MPKFNYTAKTKEAQTIRDMEEATSREELIARLKARGLFIVSIKEVKVEKKESQLFSMLFSQKRSKRSSVKLYDLTFLARNLATTLSSGVTLMRSLEMLSSQTESGTLEKILRKCQDDIRGGLSLSETIMKYPKVFSVLWQGIIEVGEASGNLPFVLEKLADYLELRMEFERKVKGALIYPAILLVVASSALLIFFKVILPKFVVLFDQFNIELPTPTKVVFSISKFVEANFVFVLGIIIGGIVAFFLFKDRPEVRKPWDRISLKLPLIGSIFFYTAIERFTSTMYILLDSGLPLVYTMDVAARSVGNSFLQKGVSYAKDRVKDGASMSDEIAKLNVFPFLISEMAKVGEETGSMPEIFRKLSVFYQKELGSRIDALIAAFEPLMIVVMGVVIGGVVISLFLPLFKIATASGSM